VEKQHLIDLSQDNPDAHANQTANMSPSWFNPEPTATAYLRGAAVAVGSGLNEPTQPRAA
jgi:hypothetical protein